MVNYYGHLFTTSDTCQLGEVLNTIQPLVTDDMNRQLSLDFMDWEIQVALK